MRPCLKCGTPASDAAVTCPACGALLPTALGRTQTGHAAPEAAPPSRPPVSGPAAFRGTMLGIGSTPPAAPRPSSEPPPPSKSALKSTMIGIAPPEPPPVPLEGAPPAPFKGTMIGIAPPLPSPASEQPPATPPLAPRAMKTMVGIARPGIAPLNPGIEKARPVPEPPAVPPAPAPWVPAPAQVPPPPLPEPGRAPGGAAGPKPLRIPTVAALAIVGAAALFTAAGVALFLYRSRGVMTASASATNDGRETLKLTCAGCTGASRVRLAGRESGFEGTHATLELPAQLRVGDNHITVELERRPGRVEQVELDVPVDYRVRADTSTLTQTPPRVSVRVEAVPHTAVVVEGQPLALAPGPDGMLAGTANVDVSSKVTGMSSVVAMLERTIPYVVTPPSGAPASGEVAVRLGVTPLVVQAPGTSIVIETPTFVLAGHTAKDASVTVEGRPITVDAAGAFAQMMSVSATGETTVIVRADAKDQAPRLVPVRVRRVASLAAEGAALRDRATRTFAAIGSAPDTQRGLAVALEGNLVEVRAEPFTTILLLDVKEGCSSPPCLVRVNVGEKIALKPGTDATVFGAITGSVDGPRPGSRIPAVAADFVLKGRL